jgi:two-component system nitrate/nitrite response regulator NarL
VRHYGDALALGLAAETDLAVVGTAMGAAEGLAMLDALPADIVVVDMAIPESLATVARVVERWPAARVVALAIAETEGRVVACAEAGAVAYVRREAALGEVIAVLRGVSRGEAVCSPRIAAGLLARLGRLAAERPAVAGDRRLTRRETQILGLIDEGLANKEIARRLQIEVATVKNHVHSILEKLQVHRRGEAAARLRSLREVNGASA